MDTRLRMELADNINDALKILTAKRVYKEDKRFAINLLKRTWYQLEPRTPTGVPLRDFHLDK